MEIEFKWFGLQEKVQKDISRAHTRIYTNFYRTLICSLDEWYGMTMEDIRELEAKIKRDLDEARVSGEVRGMVEN
ncbi:phosphatidylinositol transfer protein alpha isoform-like [Strongylocentrotus purpuratus]|uniref:Phosphatidylinositol transfer protein N-terminal domain-containing protein n=1 Tax=Strongylocentrotus purpuratus TaxID=7668 RepID=A0A7M7NKC9_STRPU|nr:phosphatidylinositol transfer protein alpha isoform-like [Strongylocentrotus purpuratus]